MRRSEFVTIVFLVFSLLFSVIGLVSSWWTIRTSSREQILTGKLIVVNYTPFQTVVASQAGSNDTVTITFADWPESGTRKYDLAFLFTVTLGVSATGAVLLGLALFLIVISLFRRPLYGLARILAIVGAILLFISSLYLATASPSVLSSFVSVVPPQFSSLQGSSISGFWGNGEPWMWSGGVGWYLIFTASLLAIVATVLIQTIMREITAKPMR